MFTRMGTSASGWKPWNRRKSAPGGIRTHTVRCLRAASLTSWSTGALERKEKCNPSRTHLTAARYALVSSTPAPERGATVTAPESPQPVDAPDDDKSHVPPLTTRVVIAEDEALIRLDLKEMLEEEGYSVVGEAGDGEQAIELAREHQPDLVILDVKMPKLDGISAAEKIAEERIAPVLMLTAFSQRDLVERARDAGAMAYLVKPFSKSDLVPAIEMAVSRFSELKALENEVADLAQRLET